MWLPLTKRIRLDRASTTDAPFFFQLMNSPGWLQFIGDRGIISEELAANYIKKNIIKSYEDHGFGLYKMSLNENEIPIGICGFLKRDYLDYADIGFAILPEYEGKGYVFEVAKKLMQYGLNTLELNPILAITSSDNVRSQRLLLKIGFKETGTITPPKDNQELLLFSTL